MLPYWYQPAIPPGAAWNDDDDDMRHAIACAIYTHIGLRIKKRRRINFTNTTIISHPFFFSLYVHDENLEHAHALVLAFWFLYTKK